MSWDSVRNLIIAGWTGRDERALQAHIRELEELGVPAPRSTPIFYRVSASLLTTAEAIQVMGTDSTGEVEFVLVRDGARLLLGVGSDHTDRKAETMGVTLSKQLCPKPVSPELWEFEAIESHWDDLMLRSWGVRGGECSLYQEGRVSAMRHPRDLIARCGGLPSGTAMFGGTFAVQGGVRWADEFRVELEDPVLGRKLTHRYTIEALPVEG